MVPTCLHTYPTSSTHLLVPTYFLMHAHLVVCLTTDEGNYSMERNTFYLRFVTQLICFSLFSVVMTDLHKAMLILNLWWWERVCLFFNVA